MNTPALWYTRVRELTMRLVAWPSVTNSEGEARFAHELHELIASHPYFVKHPHHVWLERTSDDRYQRSNLFALVRGRGRQTVILAGHYDTVSVENYGSLAPLALNPDALLPALIEELRADIRSEADRLALHDLESGNFLPGRGILDMKSGLAAGLAILQRFAESAERVGNLLLIATPDEEGSSDGMRSAVGRLSDIAQQHELALAAAINLDATSDQGDGAEGRAVFLGSVGKLLPAVLLVGRPTHAGYPFDGINANLLAAELVLRLECNPELSDHDAGELTPPPINLKLTDSKDWYDVTTPQYAWCTFNVLTHTAAPQHILQRVRQLVAGALDDAIALIGERLARFSARSGSIMEIRQWEPRVLLYSELQERAFKMLGTHARQRWEELTTTLAARPGMDAPTFSRLVTQELARWAKLDGPAAVICFASLYYPPVRIGSDTSEADHDVALSGGRRGRLRRVIAEQAGALAAETGQSIRARSYFPGISDMSFLGAYVSAADAALVAANSPAWPTLMQVDFGAVSALQMPVVNIGPWGRDYHQRLERVHAPYAFGILPELVWRVATQMLREEPSPGRAGASTGTSDS